ncbi:MAG: Polar-differentiation response regulator DivK [Syntrophorhabdaceae bacterium PtaU1.Bin034]|nr:MAG: Polar-differentiation response regulator DivK [Syntrophorhabdaceae bacterium PtaU1.Bin034]
MEKKYIVVVGDEGMVEEMIQHMLEKKGYETFSFNDPRDALSFLEKHHEKVDLVISDGRMPHIDGWELAHTLSEIDPRTPVILITGFMKGERERHGNVKAVLSKPILRDELLEAVKAVIGS